MFGPDRDEGINIRAFEAELERQRRNVRKWLIPLLLLSLGAISALMTKTVVSLSAKDVPIEKLFPQDTPTPAKNTEYPTLP